MRLGPAEIIVILVTLGLLFLPTFFFIRSLQALIAEVSVENRRIEPKQFWYLFIPLFNLVWQFIVVNRIADSLKSEFAKREIEVDEEKPGQTMGLAFAVLMCCGAIPNIGAIACLIGGIFFIMYWVKINNFRSLLQQKPQSKA